MVQLANAVICGIFQADALGAFDAVIHNVGVYQKGAEQLLHVNTLAPYMLTDPWKGQNARVWY